MRVRFRSVCLFVLGLMATVFIGRYLEVFQRQKDTYLSGLINSEIRSVQQDTESKAHEVILSSYMRSGSTFSGAVLGWREDSFYLYEPFCKPAQWIFYSGKDTICRAERPDCFKMPPWKAPNSTTIGGKQNKTGVSFNGAMAILNRLLDCNFTDYTNKIVTERLSAKTGGHNWKPFNDCKKETKNTTKCLGTLRKSCLKAKHRVSKILRFTVDNFETLLKERPNLKLIHLFRDPRAVINSRIETTWFPASDTQTVTENAKILCQKMIQDYEGGVALEAKYKHRFRFVYYEDLSTPVPDNPMKKMKSLYRYLGMSLNENTYTDVSSMRAFKTNGDMQKSERARNTAFWWRTSLTWDTVKEIDRVCETVYQRLGFKTFNSEADMRNLTKPSVFIAKQYRLV